MQLNAAAPPAVSSRPVYWRLEIFITSLCSLAGLHFASHTLQACSSDGGVECLEEDWQFTFQRYERVLRIVEYIKLHDGHFFQSTRYLNLDPAAL